MLGGARTPHAIAALIVGRPGSRVPAGADTERVPTMHDELVDAVQPGSNPSAWSRVLQRLAQRLDRGRSAQRPSLSSDDLAS
jgi:hypothetical protein